MLPALNGTLISPTVYDFCLCVSKGSGEQYYYLGFYEPGTLQVMRLCLRSGDVFIDAGSSVGQMSLYASMLVGPSGKVLAFEPHRERYSDLLNGIAVNQRSNIDSFNIGLGEAPRRVKLYVDKVSPSMVRTGNADPFQLVQVDSLDNVLDQSDFHSVRMVKIDVEGFDVEVLRGSKSLLSSSDAPILIVEHGVYDNGKDDLFSFLTSVNEYRFFRLSKTKKYASRLRPLDLSRPFRGHDNVFASCHRTCRNCHAPLLLNEMPVLIALTRSTL
jgi:FkbM family methyltransferase